MKRTPVHIANRTAAWPRNVRLLLMGMALCSIFAQSVLPLEAQDSRKKIFIFGIDGCRADAMLRAQTPTIDSLLRISAYSMDALTLTKTVSGPGWSSMMTGVWEDKHGVLDNTFTGANYSEYPPFIDRVEAYNPLLQTASIVRWAPLGERIHVNADITLSAASDTEVINRTIEVLQSSDPDIVFVQVNDVDAAGHSKGFDLDAPKYIAAIEEVDSLLGLTLNALRARPEYNAEEWLVIVSSDHGGSGGIHGKSSPEERIVPLIISGREVITGEIARTSVAAVSRAAVPVFNGENDDASLENARAFGFGRDTDFTIECWLRSDGWNGDPAFIAQKDMSAPQHPGFMIGAAGVDTPKWKTTIADGESYVEIEGGRIDDGQWHHLAVSVDRDGLMIAYQDGFIVGRRPVSRIGSIDNNLAFALAQDGALNYPHFFKGTIAEVRVWDAVLDEAALTTERCRSFNPAHRFFTNLQARWPCDDGTGSVLRDHSANGRHLTRRGSSAAQWTAPGTPFICRDYSATPRIVDVAATALRYLEIPIESEWGLVGVPVGLPALPDTSATSITEAPTATSLLAPIPTANEIVVRVGGSVTPPFNVAIYDSIGRTLYNDAKQNTNAFVIDCRRFGAGVYVLHIQGRNSARSQRFIVH